MTIYTIQVSDHAEAGLRIATAAGEASWKTVFDGKIATAALARAEVDRLANTYRNVRVFKGNGALGKFHYGVFR